MSFEYTGVIRKYEYLEDGNRLFFPQNNMAAPQLPSKLEY